MNVNMNEKPQTYLVILDGVEISEVSSNLEEAFTGDEGGVGFLASVLFCLEDTVLFETVAD